MTPSFPKHFSSFPVMPLLHRPLFPFIPFTFYFLSFPLHSSFIYCSFPLHFALSSRSPCTLASRHFRFLSPACGCISLHFTVSSPLHVPLFSLHFPGIPSLQLHARSLFTVISTVSPKGCKENGGSQPEKSTEKHSSFQRFRLRQSKNRRTKKKKQLCFSRLFKVFGRRRRKTRAGRGGR